MTGRSPGLRRLAGRCPPLVAVVVSAMIYTVVQGFTYPLLSLILAARSVPEWEIGLNAAMMPIGMLASSVIAPRIVSRVGMYVVCRLSLLGVSASLLLIGLIVNPWAWLPLRFATGFLLSMIFITTDTWVNELVDDATRGRIVGLYTIFLTVGFGLGPATLSVTGSEGATPFVIAVSLPLVAVLPLLAVRRRLPTSSGLPSTPTLGLFRRAPVLLTCIAVISFADQGTMALLPVYGILVGFTESQASVLLVVMIIGRIALMFPMGWLADHMSRTRLATYLVLGTTAFTLTFPFTSGRLATLLVSVFFWGGLYYAVYTLTMIRIGEQYRGPELVTATSACAATWGIGGIIGTPIVGGSMQALGPNGFTWSLTAAFVLLLGVLVRSRLRERRRGADPPTEVPAPASGDRSGSSR